MQAQLLTQRASAGSQLQAKKPAVNVHKRATLRVSAQPEQESEGASDTQGEVEKDSSAIEQQQPSSVQTEGIGTTAQQEQQPSSVQGEDSSASEQQKQQQSSVQEQDVASDGGVPILTGAQELINARVCTMA